MPTRTACCTKICEAWSCATGDRGDNPMKRNRSGRHRLGLLVAVATVIPAALVLIGLVDNTLSFIDRFGFWLATGGFIAYMSVVGLYAAYLSRPSTLRSVAAISLVVMLAGGVAILVLNWPRPDADAKQAERQWDGKDPRHGPPGCVDPPPSDRVDVLRPEVVGPDGKVVGQIELRTYHPAECPSVIWGRVLWDGRPEGTYSIPEGWTLHVVAHRPSTNTHAELTETSRSTPVKYGLGPMLVTARGCVAVEAYFSNVQGLPTTPPAATVCTSP